MIGDVIHSEWLFFLQDCLPYPLLQFVYIFLQFLPIASFIFEMGSRELEVVPGKFHETRPIVCAGSALALKPVRCLQNDENSNLSKMMNLELVGKLDSLMF